MSKTEPKRWTVKGFIDEFALINETAEDQSFAFLLGAGASLSSGIKTGGQMAQEWIRQLYDRHIDSQQTRSLEDWAPEFLPPCTQT